MQEFRDRNGAAPDIAVGMEGAPGHQAAAFRPDGTLDPESAGHGYGNYPTTSRRGSSSAILKRLRSYWS